MARLAESQQTLIAIKIKALNNAKRLGTYKTRSSFKPGKIIQTFEEVCSQIEQRH